MPFADEIEAAVAAAHVARINSGIAAEKADKPMPAQLEAKIRTQMQGSAAMYEAGDREVATVQMLLSEIDALRARLDALEAQP